MANLEINEVKTAEDAKIATFGVKVPEELKKEISELMKSSGLSGKDFMQSLINVYQVEKTKEQLPEVTQELKELQGLTQRINNIYLNLGYRIDNLMKSKDSEIEQQLKKKDEIISNLQDQVAEFDNKNEVLTEAFNNSVNEKNELNSRVNQLTESNNNIKALVDEYRSKNDTLTGLLNEYKASKEENEALKERLNQANLRTLEINNEKIAMGREVEQLKGEVEKLTSEINVLKVEHRNEIDTLKENNKENIEKAISEITRAKDSEKREEILNLKEGFQGRIQKTQEEAASKINEYQEKYKGLLEELESLKPKNKKVKDEASK